MKKTCCSLTAWGSHWTRPSHVSLADCATTSLAWGMKSGGSTFSMDHEKGCLPLNLQALFSLLPNPSSFSPMFSEVSNSHVSIRFIHHLQTNLWLGSKAQQTGSILSCPSGSPWLEQCKDAHTALGNLPNSRDSFGNYLLNGQERMTAKETQGRAGRGNVSEGVCPTDRE